MLNVTINGNSVRQLFALKAEVKDLQHHYLYYHCC